MPNETLYAVEYEWREDGGGLHTGHTVISGTTPEAALAAFRSHNRHLHSAKIINQEANHEAGDQ